MSLDVKQAEKARKTVFQDGLFDPSRMVERTLVSGTLIRLRLEPLDSHRVRVLEYHRKRAGVWQRCLEEEGRVLDYRKLRLPQNYSEIFA